MFGRSVDPARSGGRCCAATSVAAAAEIARMSARTFTFLCPAVRNTETDPSGHHPRSLADRRSRAASVLVAGVCVPLPFEEDAIAPGLRLVPEQRQQATARHHVEWLEPCALEHRGRQICEADE